MGSDMRKTHHCWNTNRKHKPNLLRSRDESRCFTTRGCAWLTTAVRSSSHSAGSACVGTVPGQLTTDDNGEKSGVFLQKKRSESATKPSHPEQIYKHVAVVIVRFALGPMKKFGRNRGRPLRMSNRHPCAKMSHSRCHLLGIQLRAIISFDWSAANETSTCETFHGTSCKFILIPYATVAGATAAAAARVFIRGLLLFRIIRRGFETSTEIHCITIDQTCRCILGALKVRALQTKFSTTCMHPDGPSASAQSAVPFVYALSTGSRKKCCHIPSSRIPKKYAAMITSNISNKWEISVPVVFLLRASFDVRFLVVTCLHPGWTDRPSPLLHNR